MLPTPAFLCHKVLPKEVRLQPDASLTPSSCAPVAGVWTPGGPEADTADGLDCRDGDASGPPPSAPSPVPAVWTPRSAAASPQVERKAFRPVNFASPLLPRKEVVLQQVSEEGEKNIDSSRQVFEPLGTRCSPARRR